MTVASTCRSGLYLAQLVRLTRDWIHQRADWIHQTGIRYRFHWLEPRLPAHCALLVGSAGGKLSSRGARQERAFDVGVTRLRVEAQANLNRAVLTRVTLGLRTTTKPFNLH